MLLNWSNEYVDAFWFLIDLSLILKMCSFIQLFLSSFIISFFFVNLSRAYRQTSYFGSNAEMDVKLVIASCGESGICVTSWIKSLPKCRVDACSAFLDESHF